MKKYHPELEKKLAQRSYEASTVKNAVTDLLKFYKLKKKFNELDIMEAWRSVLGESVAKRTLKLQVNERIMYVKLESASLKNELMMSKNHILQTLNQVAGESVIDDLIFQ